MVAPLDTAHLRLVPRSRNQVRADIQRLPPEVRKEVSAYAITPEHQGKGFATEAAAALVSYAFASGEVRVVRAHTLPLPNASTRVLTKCGFQKAGEVIDPDDGLVWRWERGA
jgi:ribosomal-protein-alanine N-acetyltransferase